MAGFRARLGYTVMQARDGRTAIQTAIAENPKLILLDLLPPDMDGMEVARQFCEIFP